MQFALPAVFFFFALAPSGCLSSDLLLYNGDTLPENDAEPSKKKDGSSVAIGNGIESSGGSFALEEGNKDSRKLFFDSTCDGLKFGASLVSVGLGFLKDGDKIFYSKSLGGAAQKGLLGTKAIPIFFTMAVIGSLFALDQLDACGGDTPMYVTFSQMHVYVQSAVSDAIEKNNIMSWVNKIEQDFSDLVSYMNEYAEAVEPGYKEYYISNAVPKAGDLHRDLFELDDRYWAMFGLSASNEDDRLEFKILLLKASQIFAAHSIVIHLEAMFGYERIHGFESFKRELLPNIHARIKAIQDLAKFYQTYFLEDYDKLEPWRRDKITFEWDESSSNSYFDDCNQNSCKVSERYASSRRLRSLEGAVGGTGMSWHRCYCKAKLILTDEMNEAVADNEGQQIPAMAQNGGTCCYPSTSQEEALIEDVVANWLHDILSNDWRYFPEMVQTKLDGGFVLKLINRRNEKCLTADLNSTAVAMEDCCARRQDTSNQRWRIDSALTFRLEYDSSKCVALTSAVTPVPNDSIDAIVEGTCDSSYTFDPRMEWTFENGQHEGREFMIRSLHDPDKYLSINDNVCSSQHGVSQYGTPLSVGRARSNGSTEFEFTAHGKLMSYSCKDTCSGHADGCQVFVGWLDADIDMDGTMDISNMTLRGLVMPTGGLVAFQGIRYSHNGFKI